MPALSVKAKARIAAIFMLITPLQPSMMLQGTGEKLCPKSQQRLEGEMELFPGPAWQRAKVKLAIIQIAQPPLPSA
jgi:hypothetical protein